MISFRTCRICHEACDSDGLVKYGVRSYGHGKCLLDRHGVEVLDRLSLAALEEFPVLALRGRVASPLEHMIRVIEERRAKLASPKQRTTS